MCAPYRVVQTGPVCCESLHRLACVDTEGGHFEHYLWLLL